MLQNLTIWCCSGCQYVYLITKLVVLWFTCVFWLLLAILLVFYSTWLRCRMLQVMCPLLFLHSGYLVILLQFPQLLTLVFLVLLLFRYYKMNMKNCVISSSLRQVIHQLIHPLEVWMLILLLLTDLGYYIQEPHLTWQVLRIIFSLYVFLINFFC